MLLSLGQLEKGKLGDVQETENAPLPKTIKSMLDSWIVVCKTLLSLKAQTLEALHNYCVPLLVRSYAAFIAWLASLSAQSPEAYVVCGSKCQVLTARHALLHGVLRCAAPWRYWRCTQLDPSLFFTSQENVYKACELLEKGQPHTCHHVWAKGPVSSTVTPETWFPTLMHSSK